MGGSGWNHNVQYHDVLLNSFALPAARALDVGCGEGLLTRRLASRCHEVIGIDCDPMTLPDVHSVAWPTNVAFVSGDVMTHSLPSGAFDCITAVAALHHLPLDAALMRFRELLAPGGTLAIVGLYRPKTFSDYVVAAVALPISRLKTRLQGSQAMLAPMQSPCETLRDIRIAAERLLPGCTIERRLFFRYTLVWRKPPVEHDLHQHPSSR